MQNRKIPLRIFHICMVHLFAISCYLCVLANDDTLNPSAVVAVKTEENEEGLETKQDNDLDIINQKISNDAPVEMFQPTKEWQVIKPGQSIPPGLHVRMDFQTGIKEAKFLDPEDEASSGDQNLQVLQEDRVNVQNVKVTTDGEIKESVDMEKEKMKYWKDGDHEGMKMTDKDHFTKKDLKDALKKFKAGMDDVKDEEAAKKLQEKYRSYSELKKDFEAMNVQVETDTEIMQRLVNQYKEEGASLQQRVNVLHELEYYVHQIDNAQNLESINGFKMLVEGLNNTESEIKEACSFVLGSAFQSNPKVQIQGVQEGAMTSLLRLIYVDQPFSVQKKALYAISSLIRLFPHAQHKFVTLGGVTSLFQILQRKSSEMLPLQIRAITLLNDLVTEHKSAQDTFDNDSSDTVAKQRLEQYNKVNIAKIIQEQGCLVVWPLFSSDHDVREKVLLAMNNLLQPCKEHFSNNELINHLNEMKQEYQILAKEEVEDGETEGFFSNMLRLVEQLIIEQII